MFILIFVQKSVGSLWKSFCWQGCPSLVIGNRSQSTFVVKLHYCCVAMQPGTKEHWHMKLKASAQKLKPCHQSRYICWSPWMAPTHIEVTQWSAHTSSAMAANCSQPKHSTHQRSIESPLLLYGFALCFLMFSCLSCGSTPALLPLLTIPLFQPQWKSCFRPTQFLSRVISIFVFCVCPRSSASYLPASKT